MAAVITAFFRLRHITERFLAEVGCGSSEAEEMLGDLERARAGWYDHLAGVNPHDESLYDISVDATDFLDDEFAAERITRMAQEIRYGSVDAAPDVEPPDLAQASER